MPWIQRAHNIGGRHNHPSQSLGCCHLHLDARLDRRKVHLPMRWCSRGLPQNFTRNIQFITFFYGRSPRYTGEDHGSPRRRARVPACPDNWLLGQVVSGSVCMSGRVGRAGTETCLLWDKGGRGLSYLYGRQVTGCGIRQDIHVCWGLEGISWVAVWLHGWENGLRVALWEAVEWEDFLFPSFLSDVDDLTCCLLADWLPTLTGTYPS